MELEAMEATFVKYHSIFGNILKVAFETTFPPDTVLVPVIDRDLTDDPEFVHSTGRVTRVYHPAYSDGDVSQKETGKIEFMPWVDGTEAQYHRLSFRLPWKGDHWVRFARFGEKAVFGFENPKAPFVNLDLLSLRTEGFIPLYAKIRILRSFVYILINAEADDHSVRVLTKKISDKEVPDFLAKIQP